MCHENGYQQLVEHKVIHKICIQLNDHNNSFGRREMNKMKKEWKGMILEYSFISPAWEF